MEDLLCNTHLFFLFLSFFFFFLQYVETAWFYCFCYFIASDRVEAFGAPLLAAVFPKG